MSSSSDFLITTGLEETFPKNTNEKVVFLGEWCKIYKNRSFWKDIDVQTIPYHWDNREKLYQDYQNLQVIYEKLLLELSSKLNEVHQVSYPLRYWRILIGPWLGIYTQLLFDRYTMLQTAFDLNQTYQCLAIDRKAFSSVPNDIGQFVELMTTDDWNEDIYLQLIELCFASKIKITRIKKLKKVRHNAQKKTLLKEHIKVRLLPFLSKFLIKEKDIFLISSYLPLKIELKLQIILGQIPTIWTTRPLSIVKPCPKQRNWQLKGHGASSFEEVLRSLIPKHIPTAYIEGYSSLNDSIDNLPWPRTPKSIFTSNAYFFDDFFKAWVAKKTENHTPFIIGQHGGGFGMSPFAFFEDHQIKIADSFLSWGWSDKKRKNIKPVGNIKCVGKHVDYNRKGGALMVELNLSRYSHHLYASPLASQLLDYFNDQKVFLSSLPIELRSQVLLRLNTEDYGWNWADRWKDSMPEVNVDLGHKDLKLLIENSRICISTYNATTFLESMIWNIPTIIFWNTKHWELNEIAKPYFKLLEKAGIFHATPQNAAQKMIDVWYDVDVWWYSNDVQKARQAFIDQYSCVPKKPLKLLEGILNPNIQIS